MRLVVTSPYVLETVAALTNSGEALVANQKVTPNHFRDITGHHHCDDLWAKVIGPAAGYPGGVPPRGDIEGVFCFFIEHHKTTGKYGALQIPLVEPQHKVLLDAYVEVARPKLLPRGSEDDEALPLFCSTRPPYSLDLPKATIKWLIKAIKEAGVDDPHLDGFTSGALRKAFADLGKSSKNEFILENMTTYMAHSMATRDRHYVEVARPKLLPRGSEDDEARPLFCSPQPPYGLDLPKASIKWLIKAMKDEI